MTFNSDEKSVEQASRKAIKITQVLSRSFVGNCPSVVALADKPDICKSVFAAHTHPWELQMCCSSPVFFKTKAQRPLCSRYSGTPGCWILLTNVSYLTNLG